MAVSDLVSVLDAAVIAYEHAAWASDQGMVDFDAYRPLAGAIRVLRGLVRAGGGAP